MLKKLIGHHGVGLVVNKNPALNSKTINPSIAKTRYSTTTDVKALIEQDKNPTGIYTSFSANLMIDFTHIDTNINQWCRYISSNQFISMSLQVQYSYNL